MATVSVSKSLTRSGGGNPAPSAVSRWLFYHTDHLGSPRVIADASGAVVSTHHYMPFGEEKPIAGRVSANNVMFTGHQRDVESASSDNPDGLDYMLARYYSSSLGRFMAVDPALKIGKNLPNPQRWNRYTYTLNNPLSFVDPDGRDVTYADDNAKKHVDAARAVSPGTNAVISRMANDKTKQVTYRTGDAPDDKPPQKKLGETKTDVSKGEVTFKATVTIDQKDIDATPGADPRTVVIHETVGHLDPNSKMTPAEASKTTPEGREAKAQELTAEELAKIPEDKRPAPIPNEPKPEKKDK